MEGLREKFWKWKEAFETKGLKENRGKTKVLVSGVEGEKNVSKIDPCGRVRNSRAPAIPQLCLAMGKLQIPRGQK